MKAAVRQVWRKTSRVKHIKEVRFPHPDPDSPFKYAVPCAKCGRIFGQSEKRTYATKSGRRRRTGAYHVNHICDLGLPEVVSIPNDLGNYALKCLETPVEVLCVECHNELTEVQMRKRFSKTIFEKCLQKYIDKGFDILMAQSATDAELTAERCSELRRSGAILTNEGLPHIKLHYLGLVENITSGKFLKTSAKCFNVSFNKCRVPLSVELLSRKYFNNHILNYEEHERCDLAKFGADNYVVTIDGRIWSVGRSQWVTLSMNVAGYQLASLSQGSAESRKTYIVHRLVAQAFLSNPDNKPEVNHKNSIRHWNHVDNLEWATSQENSDHARISGNALMALSDSLIHRICEGISKGVRDSKLSNDLGVELDYVTRIRLGYAHTSISAEYDFPDKHLYKYSHSVYGSIGKIHKACQLLETGMSTNDVAKEIGVRNSSIKDLRRGRNFTEISTHYKF